MSTTLLAWTSFYNYASQNVNENTQRLISDIAGH